MKPKKKAEFNFQELSDKDHKSLKILDLISRKGIISRSEISRITGINVVSISNYIKKYIDKKLIMEKGFDVSTGGRKPELVELNKDENRVIGVDIGSDYIRVVVTDMGLNIVEKAHKPLERPKTKEVIDAVCGLVETTIKKAGLTSSDILATGIGTAIDEYAPAGEELQERTLIETFSGDEPSCAAFGERSANKKIPDGDFLYIYSDRGRGVVVRDDGNRISERESKYLSPWKDGLSALSLARSDVARGVGTEIVELAHGRMENITFQTLIDAARNNDEVALSIMRSIGMSLGLRIAYLVNLFDPKSVVLGGGIEKAGELILDPIKKTVKRLSLKDRSATVAIIPGILDEEAVSLGAAYLAAREMFLEA